MVSSAACRRVIFDCCEIPNCHCVYDFNHIAPLIRIREGYLTTTQIRFLLTVQDAGDQQQQVVDQSIKQLMAQIHRYYVEYTLNPFNDLNAPVQSQKFTRHVQQCVDKFNGQ
jgi:hypothetical protein